MVACNPDLATTHGHSVYKLTKGGDSGQPGDVYVGTTCNIRARIMQHARRLSKGLGMRFVDAFKVEVLHTGLDKDTAGELERRITWRLVNLGASMLNSSRIKGPLRGRMLTYVIMAAKAKQR